jgi:hypothetical protein
MKKTLLRVAAAALAASLIGLAGPANGALQTVAGVIITPSLPIYTVSVPATFTLRSDGLGAEPVKYRYWVNEGRVRQVRADGGHASITVTPVTRTSRLTVQAVGADGSLSPVVLTILLARLAEPAADKDSDGDGHPDLIVAGDAAGLDTGAWFASGRSTGRVVLPAANIGIEGGGLGTGADYDGTRIITGNFLGNGYQDVLAYRAGGDFGAGGFIVSGTGDGSVMSPISGNQLNIFAQILSDMAGNTPRQIVNAYNASGNSPYIPDLMGTSGSPAGGYFLHYYPNQGQGVFNYYAVQMSNATPAGGTDWENWHLASLLLPSGTAMFLWNTATGALYLWQGIALVDNGDYTGSLTYTQHLITEQWAVQPGSSIEAADFTGDAIPDLWAVSTAGVVTPYVVTRLSPRARIVARTPQQLG